MRDGGLFMTRLEQDTENVRREQHIEKATDGPTVNKLASVNVSKKNGVDLRLKNEGTAYMLIKNKTPTDTQVMNARQSKLHSPTGVSL